MRPHYHRNTSKWHASFITNPEWSTNSMMVVINLNLRVVFYFFTSKSNYKFSIFSIVCRAYKKNTFSRQECSLECSVQHDGEHEEKCLNSILIWTLDILSFVLDRLSEIKNAIRCQWIKNSGNLVLNLCNLTMDNFENLSENFTALRPEAR